jgi:peptidoglycan hydrolase CwlO-like protein
MSKNLLWGVVVLTMLVVLALFLPTSCKWKTTKTAIKHGDILKSSIEDFEKNRQKLSESLVKNLEAAGAELVSENPDLQKVSKDFEKEWSDIQSRYKKLKDDFEKVGKSSTAYFQQLNELSGQIKNEKLRTDELAKNKELEARWNTTYQEASVNVEKVTTVLEAGHDFHMVLVASSIRQKLEQNVEELNVIAAQAKELLADLESFTQEGRKLVQG